MQGYAHIYQQNLAHYKRSKQEGSARIMANVSLSSILLQTHMARFHAGLAPGQSPTVCTHQLRPTQRMRRVSEKEKNGFSHRHKYTVQTHKRVQLHKEAQYLYSHKSTRCLVTKSNVFCCCKNNGLVTKNKNYIQSQKQTYLLEEMYVSSQNQLSLATKTTYLVLQNKSKQIGI